MLGSYYLEPKLLYFVRRYSKHELVSVVNYLHAHGIELRTIQKGANRYAYMYIPKTISLPLNSVRLIVLLGGNAMTALDWAEWIVQTEPHINSSNAVFLCVDYPGYGASAGVPSPTSMHVVVNESVSEAIGQLESSGSVVTNISVLGHSIGAAVATRWVASNNSLVDTLILSAPFTSVSEMVPEIFPFVPAWLGKLLLWHNWDTKKQLSSIPDIKIHIIHGEDDGIVPFRMGKELSGIRGKLHAITQTGHNDILNNYDIYGKLIV